MHYTARVFRETGVSFDSWGARVALGSGEMVLRLGFATAADAWAWAQAQVERFRGEGKKTVNDTIRANPTVPGIPRDGETLAGYLARQGIENFTARETLTARRVGVVSDPPPREWWPRIVPTLRLAEMLRVVMGHPLIVGNGYRPPAVNRRAGGSWRSRHIHYQALDLDLPKDKRSWSNRLRFYEAAVSMFLELGDEYQIGLGLYSRRGGTRVHLDTGFKRRRWGGRRGAWVDEIAEGLR